MLKGRLGLESSRIPHADRDGLLYLEMGVLASKDGTLIFRRNLEEASLPPGDYGIPVQGLSMILLGPGGSVTQDALRLLARANTALIAVGRDGVRCYSAPPLLSDHSTLARAQAAAWTHEPKRLHVARRMYAWRLGEVLPYRDIAALRGIEGAHMRTSYKIIADRVGIKWQGRRYDRANPLAADLPNQALNHAATAVEAAAMIAVYATATLSQLGFIHEDSGLSFILDIADLYRTEITIPCAFHAARECAQGKGDIERLARQKTGYALRHQKVIPSMIEKIKLLFENTDAPIKA
ncbi:type I-E CRISPR-associated endonuclease Cas1e [Oecophyllibacter saccharovorans]|uniref:CRISPR-associated endonuclease Cas1 n=1 Tax=Oecophyllibacter saccharovorans TaxID=2558360 RepID=A0A506USD0_9PROT|nr:type I-E CRISPR-associated endonuclease Cas1e [Oecophyllibacter saccharovorans]TPW36003.1 type I-E CRISPR-associated endonuclease Cas1 [Oecophyllibacter saccharovorans]